MASNDPLQKHVEASLRKTLREMFLNQPLRFRDDEKELANTLKWFDNAFDVIRGFEIEIRQTASFRVDEEGEIDHDEKNYHVSFQISVADQADMEFVMGADGDSIEILRRRIRHMLNAFEVLDNGVAMSIVKQMDKPGDMDRVFIAGGTICFGFNPDDVDDYRMEISDSEILDMSTGKPYHLRLIY